MKLACLGLRLPCREGGAGGRPLRENRKRLGLQPNALLCLRRLQRTSIITMAGLPGQWRVAALATPALSLFAHRPAALTHQHLHTALDPRPRGRSGQDADGDRDGASAAASCDALGTGGSAFDRVLRPQARYPQQRAAATCAGFVSCEDAGSRSWRAAIGIPHCSARCRASPPALTIASAVLATRRVEPWRGLL